MKINQIILKNFKVFRDHKIEFSSSDDKNVTLVYGVNGAGKSSLFRAINWVLYGDKLTARQTNLPDISLELKTEMIEGQIEEMKVVLKAAHEQTTYVIERSSKYQLKNEELIEIKNSMKTLLHINKGKERPQTYEDEDTIRKIISSIFPYASKDYFLCDGEEIEELAKQKKDAIEQAIRQVLSLEYLDNAITNLEGIATDWRKLMQGVEGASDEFKERNDLLTRKQNKLNVLEKEEIELKNILLAKEKKYNDKRTEYESLKQEREQIRIKFNLEDRQREVKKAIEEDKENLRKLLTTSYLIYAKKIAEESKELLDRWNREGKYPRKDYTLEFIQKILKENKCFLWEFKEKSKEHKYFEERLYEVQNWGEGISSMLMNLQQQIYAINNRRHNDFERIREDHKKYTEAIKREIEIDQQLKDINKSIHSDITEEKLKQLDTEYETAKDEHSEAEHDLESKREEKTKLEDEIEILEKSLESINFKDKKGKTYKKRFDLSTESKRILKDLIAKYTQEKRQEVEKRMQGLFKVLMTDNQEELKPPTLDQNYHLKVRYSWEKNDTDTNVGIENLLSSGQGQLLILSFIAALAKTANEKAPFLMDTPLARISIAPTTAVCKYLPEQVSQLILFVTDKELSHEGELLLQKRCEKIWTLTSEYTNGKRKVIIKPGKHVLSDYSKKV